MRKLAALAATAAAALAAAGSASADVPNATVMVILDADRFGIAQLHQLRGRVGRGADASSCWLVGAGTTPDGEARLEALVKTTDGFELAEVDLELRGEGTLMGERQKGRNDLKLASLRRDKEWVVRAREVAFELVDDDPDLGRHAALHDEIALFLGDDEAEAVVERGEDEKLSAMVEGNGILRLHRDPQALTKPIEQRARRSRARSSTALDMAGKRAVATGTAISA